MKHVLCAAAAAAALLAPLSAGPLAAQSAPETAPKVRVIPEVKHDTSPPLRDMPYRAPRPVEHEMEHELMHQPKGTNTLPDAALQLDIPGAPTVLGTPLVQFDGITAATSFCGCAPPDTVGEVGPNHYVQMSNVALQVFSKAGASLFGPVAINSIWTGFGGACELENTGDPIVLYDQLADRWLISQFTDLTPPFHECVAVSATGDPTGAWHRYAFQTSLTKFDDYPKLGVWPDGYYMTANLFTISLNWAGTGFYAMDRAKMLDGLAATMQLFELPPSDWGGALPSDLDGLTPPPPGAPNVMVEVLDGAWDPGNWPNDELHFHEFHVDWAVPANSTFNNVPVQVAVAAFDGLLCNFASCVPQVGTAQKLDTLSDRLMHRMPYRNFGTHESLVLNHSVDAGADRAAIRWYEVRNPAGSPAIHQQGTFAPADTLHRWMGSAAMDRQGNMAVGYSGSSTTQSPDIRYTGRLVGDALGTLPQGEQVMITSTASSTGTGRWGDYSALSVDPTNDCDYWFTTEYATGSGFNWKTRIGAFRFAECKAIFVNGFETGTTSITSIWSDTQP